eukprot:14895-Prymnesium_polylepis.1
MPSCIATRTKLPRSAPAITLARARRKRSSIPSTSTSPGLPDSASLATSISSLESYLLRLMCSA